MKSVRLNDVSPSLTGEAKILLDELIRRKYQHGMNLRKMLSLANSFPQLLFDDNSEKSSFLSSGQKRISNRLLGFSTPNSEDPEVFLFQCNFNKAFSCNALADLDASMNLMPYSLYAKLSLETLKPTKMSVRLADKSFQYPVGIVENMLVEVGKFTFPTDFVILEMEEDSKVPLILGRPFLHTADAVI
ncbi:reverse transcriptase domain-containing protein [Tanacetum coccineum]